MFNKGYKLANIFLAGFFLLTSLFLLAQYSGLYGQSVALAAIIGSSITPFVFLIGPFSYFYFRGVFTDDARLSKKDYLHFAIFIVEFIGMIPYYFSSWGYKLQIASTLISENWNVTHLNLNFLFPSPINSYLRPLHLLFYLLMQWLLLIRYKKTSANQKVKSDQYSIINRWATTFTIVYTCFLICFALISYLLLKFDTRTAFIYHSSFVLLTGTILIVILNLLPFLFPQLLYGAPRYQVQNSNIQLSEVSMSVESEKPALHIAASAVRDETIINLEAQLNKLMSNSMPWTDPNFSIATLAIELGVPQHHLRYYFNQHLNISFSVYRNRMRVEHAKSLLQNADAEQYSVEGIGTLAGFSSKSSFFSVFKGVTGLTPSEYQKNCQQKG